MLETFIFIDGKIITCVIDESKFPKLDAAQFLLSPAENQRDEKNLLEKLRVHNPNFVAKQEKSDSFIQKMNYVRLELVKIYKRHSEPYTMSYKSVNQPCINLKRTYQISPYRITLNSNFSENCELSGSTGSSILPGANGYVLRPNPRNPRNLGRPRMKRSSFRC